MIRYKTALVIVGFQVLFLAGLVGEARAQLIPSPDGLTVYDPQLQVTWLKNANLAGTPGNGIDGAPAVDPGGAMNFDTALAWVAALNAANYLGRNTWSLPTTPHHEPPHDGNCALIGPLGNSFGFGCTSSALGSFYGVSLQLRYPNPAVRVPDAVTGPFHNFRPALYWSGTGGTADNPDGWRTFSFNTGSQGGNTGVNYLHALPMLDGPICTNRYCPDLDSTSDARVHWVSSGVGSLKITDDGLGLVVYDEEAVDPENTDHSLRGVTWVANANLAEGHRFGAQCSAANNLEVTAPCITADGAMSHSTAADLITGMNTFRGEGWLGATGWKLPPVFAVDTSCDASGHFGCTRSPMGRLYYTQLGFAVGTPVVSVQDRFGTNLQPYLYWSCSASLIDSRVCAGDPHADPPSIAVPDLPSDEFGWSFSFGNGFQGTEDVSNHLYVMVYYPESPLDALNDALAAALGDDPQYANLLASLEQQAQAISSETAPQKDRDLRRFVREVNARRGNGLTDAEANQIIALARAL